MKKPRVLFPFVEAGMGHIVPLKSVADVFEQKYGDRTEVVRSNFYTDANTEAMTRFQTMLVNEVSKHNRIHGYARMCFATMGFFKHLALRAIMEWFIKDSYTDSIAFMQQLNPDLVFSTHWATSYYAHRIEQKPINIEYCPDVRLDVLWKTGAELILMPAESAAARYKKKHVFKDQDIRCVPFIIRKEAFEITRDKRVNRQLLGLDENLFTVTLANGGYGAGNLGKIVEKLIKTDCPMNVVAICGKNQPLYEQLRQFKANPNIRFYPIGFTQDMLRYIAASDLFVGKSGANSMAEPRFFGVPMLITMYATQIETENGEYYINEVGCAMKEFNADKAVAKIIDFAARPELLQPYAENARKNVDSRGAEVVADILYDRLKRKFDLPDE